jgi:hypothetical protein
MRISFAGASGTGKSTLAAWLAGRVQLPLNPVGSRSVALEMGLTNEAGEPDPYLADERRDAEGRPLRAEFQRRLLAAKVAWELETPAFVTDRTTLDNAVYAILHGAGSIRAQYLKDAVAGMRRYDAVFYCPAETFMRVGGDTARVGGRRAEDLTAEDARAYHDVFNALLFSLLVKHSSGNLVVLSMEGLEARKAAVSARLRLD